MSAATQPYVLAQVSTDPLRDRYPLAIFNEATFRDGEVSVRLKPVSMSTQSSAVQNRSAMPASRVTIWGKRRWSGRSRAAWCCG